MKVYNAGEILPGFELIGNAGSPLFLVRGEKPALIDAGYTFMALEYEKGLQEALGDDEPAYLFITHSHFDHIGCVAHLKKLYPEMTVAASARCQRIVTRPGAIELMTRLSASVTAMFNQSEAARQMLGGQIHEGPFEPFEVEMVLEDGQEVDLGGLTVRALETPGHTRDCLSYYLPEKRVLAASEAVGIEGSDGYITTDFLIDHDLYLASLEKMAALEVEVVCQAHGAIFTGQDARARVPRAIAAAKEFIAWVRRLLIENNRDEEIVVQLVKKAEYDPKPFPKQPEPTYLINLQNRVKTVNAMMA